MKLYTPFFLLFAFMMVAARSNCQSFIDSELQTLFKKKDVKQQDYSRQLKESKNEIDAVISSAFLAYKTFLSSQDRPSCIFSPSCSEYAVEAFQKKGIVSGWLYTFDRLSRCHGFANPSVYLFSPTKNRFYDPVE